MNLSNLTGHKFNRIKSTNGGNIYSDGALICYLKPARSHSDSNNKKPVYGLSLLDNGMSTYLSGLFATNDNNVFTGDYRDQLSIKHMVKVVFSDAGSTMDINL